MGIDLGDYEIVCRYWKVNRIEYVWGRGPSVGGTG